MDTRYGTFFLFCPVCFLTVVFGVSVIMTTSLEKRKLVSLLFVRLWQVYCPS